MDIYLTPMSGGQALRVPLLPDEVKAKESSSMINMNIISTGDVKIPRGSKLSEYSWEGVFPGEHMKRFNFIKEWAAPINYINQLRAWKSNGEKMRLLITETPINVDVYINSFSYTASGGVGDYRYSISLVDARTVTVSTVQEAGLETDTLSKMISAHYAAVRPESVTNKYQTHTVVVGDSLYSIAKQYLGDGSKWETIYNLNKEMIDAANAGKNVTKDTIYVGQVLLVKEKPYVASVSAAYAEDDYSDYGGGSSGGGGGGGSSSKKSSSSSSKKTASTVSSAVKKAVETVKNTVAAAANALKNIKSSSSSSSSIKSSIKKIISKK